MSDARLQHEIAHAKVLLDKGLSNWGHETWVGQVRAERRAGMMAKAVGMHEGTEVLELGFGAGEFTRRFAKTGAHVTAVELSPDLIEAAKKVLGSLHNVSLVQANAEQLSEFTDGRFDAAVGNGILHHLDAQQSLNRVFAKLKSGGRIAFAEPNMMNPQVAVQKNVPWIKKRMGESPDETAFFRWQMATFMRQAGFVGVTVTPFDFLYPLLPATAAKRLIPVLEAFERVPILREIAGSLLIVGQKP